MRDAQRALYERCGYSRPHSFAPYRVLRFAARRAGRDWERGRFMNPQLDDIEAELTYLRIRALRPEVVVEVAPFRGWSTTWMLHALRDNDRGSLTSFDLVEDSRAFVPAELADRWRLVVGDVRTQLPAMPERIDYLFMDADHRASFAHWFLAELMPRVDGAGSVHDVFHSADPSRSGGEAAVVVEWLQREGIPWMTPSRLAPEGEAQRIEEIRRRLGFHEPIHFGDHNSMVLFTLDERTDCHHFG